jgi:flagellar biosynthesis/type III secretory pathway protein FliH
MSLSKRLARDCLQAADVIPYRQEGQEAEPGLDGEPASRAGCRDIELDSLDLVKLGPYLLLAEVQAQADATIDRARTEAEALREQARAEGAAQGREEAKQEVLPSIVAFANAGQTLIVFEEQMIARYAPEMIHLALEIAEKIVHKAVAADPEIVASVLERARREVVDARHIRIHLNPADYRLLAEMRPDLITMGQDNGRVIEVLADEEVSRGGSRLETEIGVVDATVPTQIAEIRRQLLDEENVVSSAVLPQPANGCDAVNREL